MKENLQIARQPTSSHEITQLLVSWSDGDQQSLEKLIPLVYDALHKIAANYLRRERDSHTLQTTSLVHEAYLKLVDQNRVQWQNRAHFFAIAAQAMRRILIHHARKVAAQKRGGGLKKVTLDDGSSPSLDQNENLIALDDALKRLAEIDPQQSEVVELRYFGGLTVEETAEVLKISPRTVKREWAMARAWLYNELSDE